MRLYACTVRYVQCIQSMYNNYAQSVTDICLYLTNEKLLLIKASAPVASNNLPTPSPLVSSNTACKEEKRNTEIILYIIIMPFYKTGNIIINSTCVVRYKNLILAFSLGHFSVKDEAPETKESIIERVN